MSTDIERYVGERTLAKMRATRLHMFARALADVLYNCDSVGSRSVGGGVYWEPFPATPETKDGEKKFVVPLHVHVGDRVSKAQGAAFLAGHNDNYVDVRKMLGELMHELERLALKEVT